MTNQDVIVIPYENFTITSTPGESPKVAIFSIGADYRNRDAADHFCDTIEDAVLWIAKTMRLARIWNTTHADYKQIAVRGQRLILTYDKATGTTVLADINSLSEDELRTIETLRGINKHFR